MTITVLKQTSRFKDPLVYAGIFSATLFLYVLTLCPTVAGGDSGELTVVALKHGIAHPPGYPLYSFLSWLFTLLPWGEPAARVNFFSALCGAGAATCLAGAVKQATRDWAAAILSAGLFATLPLVWDYAVVAEVFALNNLIFALFLWAATRAIQTKSTSACTLQFLAFLTGLGATHHPTFLFAALPLVWIGLKGAPLRKLLAPLMLGFTPILY
ncbi:MAG: DUF2723 domain-containing protein, partial [Bdellovibrionota bacterium]